MNEYLKLFKELPNNKFLYSTIRDELTRKFAWAIPDQNALDIIASYSPLVEIGAGTGYWSYLLKNMDVDITAYDAFLKDKNKYKHHETWIEIKEGYPSVLNKYNSNVNLFLCWPPYDDPMAYNCLMNFKGNYIIYIGESDGGCNGDESFHELLYTEWERIKVEPIPQWYGLHDYLYVYKRVNTTKNLRKLNLE